MTAGVGVSTGGVVSGGDSGGPTIASFPLEHAGPPPWRVRVKLVGIEAAGILPGESEGIPRPATR